MIYLTRARQSVVFILAASLSASFLFGWHNSASLQTNDDIVSPDETARAAIVGVPERGGKHINFHEARNVSAGPNASGSQPVAIVSADFDSDGHADIVTADSSGGLQLFKGIDPTNFAIDPRGEKRVLPEPFSASASAAETSLGILPDLMFTGDFNADGKQDIVAASKGSNSLVLLGGNGSGQFAEPRSIGIDGNIIAAEAGEIGRKDGQTDLALAVTNERGSFLLVYEHPESAFKHLPEMIRLPALPTVIAVGNTDEDFYSDIAVACGNYLVIVHERSQAYPWDIIKDSGITRPPAVVEVRRMTFSIVSMAIGRFGEKRGTSLAMLGSDGNIHHLETPKAEVSPGAKLARTMASELKTDPFQPADSKGRAMAMISQEPRAVGKVDTYGNPTSTAAERQDPAEMLSRSLSNAEARKFDPEEMKQRNIEAAPLKAAMQQRTKDTFIRGISAKTSSLANWEVRQITTDHRFVAMAANGARLTRAAVSDSPYDELMVTSVTTEKMEFVSRFRDESGKSTVENTVIEGNGAILSILPLRLNLDGLTDLVVLRQGSSSPEVTMTAPAAEFLVNTAADDGDCNFGGSCSLRDAIRRANLVGGSSTIGFDNSVLPLTISPLSPLPALVQPINIYGNHLPDGTKLVEISGVNAGSPVDGIKIRTSNAFIYDLAITGFKSQTSGSSQIGGNGIAIESDSAHPNNAGNTVLECYLGIDTTGTTAKKNFATGLLIFDSDGNGINSNTISGNGNGIALEGGNSNNISNNIIGLNVAGTAKVGNVTGIFLAGANNTVGGDFAGAPNTISGNGVASNFAPCFGYGIAVPILVDSTTLELLSHDNNILGNKLGTDPTGGVGLGNCWQGINAHPLTATTVGSITESGRNIISGNGLGGVWCESLEYSNPTEGGFCSIMGNNVGTDITGTYSIYNDAHNTPPISGPQSAVLAGTNLSLSAIGGPGGTTPGGPCTGFCNLVSGNAGSGLNLASGVEVGGPGIAGVFNNYIGTKRNGIEALANNGAGIDMASTIAAGTSPIYFAGGHTIEDGSLGNLIAANSFDGIEAGTNGGPGDYHILGNMIGTDVSGTNALPNVYGIQVSATFSNLVEIGDSDPLGRNVIAGNSFDGILIVSGFGVKIVNNLIGVNSSLGPLGNARNGINLGTFFPAYATMVGEPDATNVIANNGSNGVRVNNSGGGPTYSNSIRGNSIYNNSGLGIDLSLTSSFGPPDGVSPNDLCDRDADIGPNTLQNYPVLFTPVDNQNGTFTIAGSLISRPHRHFTIEFYSNSSPDPTGHGEGQTYVGSADVTTDGNGFGEFTFHSPSATNIAATANDDYGNTSEFSCIAGVECDGNPAFATLEDYLATAPMSCPANLLVNLDTDEPDANPNDGFCDINTGNDDDHECTLRAAMQMITKPGYTGTHCINFAIPGGGVHTIQITSALPVVNVQMDLDATSQDMSSPTPVIKLDGTGTSGLAGFNITGGSTTVKGFSIVGFHRGIEINGPGGSNEITSNFIGVNADGMTAPPNQQQTGVLIANSSILNRIGGAQPTDRNVISNNVTGVAILSSNTNLVLNNRIGTNLTGTARLPNDHGVVVDSSSNNKIGDGEDRGNIIAGNEIDGVVLRNSSANNNVSSNYIGVDPDSNNNVPTHGIGVFIDSSANNNIIGGESVDLGNIIGGHTSGANSAGVLISADAGYSNRVLSNSIGLRRLDGPELPAIPNKYGVLIYSPDQIVGKTASGADAGNIIASNLLSGILVNGGTGSTVINAVIVANKIGTNGDLDFGNGGNGITLAGNLGDGTNIVRNIVSGNDGWGVYIDGGQYIRLKGNTIGTNGDDSVQLGNSSGGVYVKGTHNVVGGDNVSDRNIISGNSGNGIEVAAGSTETEIKHNRIGTDGGGANELQNVGNGIMLFGSKTTVRTNLISGNQDIGVRIERGAGDPVGQQNIIDSNWIGINADGVVPIPNTTGILLINGATSNTIANNVVSANRTNGISIRRGCNGNLIQGNFVGTSSDGMVSLGNLEKGISIEGSSNNIKLNTISANKVGVFIAKTNDGAGPDDASNNTLSENHIGTDVVVDNALGNTVSGIEITGGAHHNMIGNANVVSGNSDPEGNTGRGIYIYTASNSDGQTTDAPHHNRVLGNTIGGKDNATQPLPNDRNGILVDNSPDNTIGESCSGCGNIVIGNHLAGIAIVGQGSTGNTVTYNFVGVNREGLAIGNGTDGIQLTNGAEITTLAHNTVGGNAGNGIAMTNVGPNAQRTGRSRSPQTEFIKLTGNLVGVIKLPAGEFQKVGNDLNGILVEASNSIRIGIAGSNEIDKLNVLAGNAVAGLKIKLQSSDIQIVDTIIGTVPTGGFAPDHAVLPGFGNLDGIAIEGGSNTALGVVNEAVGRLNVVIEGNLRYGINLDGIDVLLNQVTNTLIKFNGGPGVIIQNGANANSVGGPASNAGNDINNNGGPGVWVAPTAGNGNITDPNSIYDNDGLGIDISELGHTPNDPGDPDEGANRGQNYPEIVNYSINSNGELTASYRVDTDPDPGNANYPLYCEFFIADPSGEGKTFLAYDYYSVADHAGSVAGTKTINLGLAIDRGWTQGDVMTASATDAGNNTSEFFPAMAPTAAGVTISGRVTRSATQGIQRAKLTLVSDDGHTRQAITNGFGYYRFDDVEAGRTYVLTVSHKQFEFSGPNRVITVVDELTDVDFIVLQ